MAKSVLTVLRKIFAWNNTNGNGVKKTIRDALFKLIKAIRTTLDTFLNYKPLIFLFCIYI